MLDRVDGRLNTAREIGFAQDILNMNFDSDLCKIKSTRNFLVAVLVGHASKNFALLGTLRPLLFVSVPGNSGRSQASPR